MDDLPIPLPRQKNHHIDNLKPNKTIKEIPPEKRLAEIAANSKALQDYLMAGGKVTRVAPEQFSPESHEVQGQIRLTPIL